MQLSTMADPNNFALLPSVLPRAYFEGPGVGVEQNPSPNFGYHHGPFNSSSYIWKTFANYYI